MTMSAGADPIGELNAVLSELIDVIIEVKQADRKVPGTHPLHREVDELMHDLASWRTALGDRDAALGVSPLAYMSSAAGRKPPNLWTEDPTDDEVCALLDEHLGRLEDHVSVALSDQTDDMSRNALAEVQQSLRSHRLVLGELRATES
jgi:DNA-binding ferritin-like protein